MIDRPLRLPCGATLSNRIAKSAMTEGLADARNCATERLARLYAAWSSGGAGLMITGNVMVDRRYLERPGNVAIDDNDGEAALAAVARAVWPGKHLWMQINHPGRQTSPLIAVQPVGPSAVPLRNHAAGYSPPRALAVAEIDDIVARFGRAASAARATGFSGVQIHAAHGYLLSSFLSPIANVRDDAWGGSLENRARLLLACVRAVRAAVGADFPIGVKLNSSDFQKGGFAPEECLIVVGWLRDAGVDLVELSGGSAEQAEAVGGGETVPPRASTLAREAYFFEFTRQICASRHRPPVMLTGGFRSRGAMDAALGDGDVDVIGIARPFCVEPDLAHRLLNDDAAELPAAERHVPAEPSAATMSWFGQQMRRIADGFAPDPALDVSAAMRDYAAIEAAMAAALERP